MMARSVIRSFNSRRCFLSSRSAASRSIPRTIMAAAANISSQGNRVSIISSYTNFVAGDSKIFSKPFLEELNLLPLVSSNVLGGSNGYVIRLSNSLGVSLTKNRDRDLSD